MHRKTVGSVGLATARSSSGDDAVRRAPLVAPRARVRWESAASRACRVQLSRPGKSGEEWRAMVSAVSVLA